MKPFNLAEAKIAERSYCKRHVARHLQVMAVLVVAVLVVAAGSFACKRSILNKAARVRMELAQVQAQCKQIDGEISGIRSGVCESKWRKQLADKSLDQLGILNSVLQRVPEDIWLSKLECASGSSSLLIEGQAASFELLSMFIGRMRRCPRFVDVRITSTQMSTTAGATIIEFNLNVMLKPPVDDTAAASGTPGPVTKLAVPVVGGSPK